MEKRLYLLLYPLNAMIASQLPPEKFARHFSVGSPKHFAGKTIFAELDVGFRHPDLPIEEALAACVPHEDGSPKQTKYISVHNTLALVDLAALGDLYLVTVDGRPLRVTASDAPEPTGASRIRVYNLICPVSYPIAANLTPLEFARYVTREVTFKRLQKVCFAELDVNAGLIADSDEPPQISPLPNTHKAHVWRSIRELAQKPNKRTKTLSIQNVFGELSFLKLKNGIWISDGETTLYYALPGYEVLKYDHPEWWRSA